MAEPLFRHVAEAGHIVEEVPWCEPVALFAPLAHEPFALLLESSGAGPGRDPGRHGRWSFIAADPFARLTARDGAVHMDGKRRDGGPFAVLAGLLDAHALAPGWLVAIGPDLPPFAGGAAGYLGYELAHELERLPRARTDPLAMPNMALGFYDAVVAFDHVARRAFIVSTGLPERTPAARAARAEARAAPWRARIALNPNLPPLAPSPDDAPKPEVRSSFTRDAYERAVQTAIDYIHAGDIFQANLSQRFSAELMAGDDAWSLYRRLRALSPAPFSSFFQMGEAALLSSSPERFLHCANGKVTTEPIKGTRPRGQTLADDAALAAELLASEKDRAENVMIVDLLRNDLSRVCRDHSVEVGRLCALESFANVHHLVSTVTGELNGGASLVDLLAACFPGGSITGAPKVRAMEIITELEGAARGPYCGAIGYLGFDGAMDTSIAIRVATVKDGVAHFQAGGGIVADSDPAAEYRETLDKARALRAAVRGERLPEPQSEEEDVRRA